MKIISHRGNLNGPNNKKENNPEYILDTINRRYNVEIDVWIKNNFTFFLGHDKPTYKVYEEFFNDQMLIHCKNKNAVDYFYSTQLHWFWHEHDLFTITSLGYVLCLNGTLPIQNCILIHTKQPPSSINSLITNHHIYGICTDYPDQWKFIL